MISIKNKKQRHDSKYEDWKRWAGAWKEQNKSSRTGLRRQKDTQNSRNKSISKVKYQQKTQKQENPAYKTRPEAWKQAHDTHESRKKRPWMWWCCPNINTKRRFNMEKTQKKSANWSRDNNLRPGFVILRIGARPVGSWFGGPQLISKPIAHQNHEKRSGYNTRDPFLGLVLFSLV